MGLSALLGAGAGRRQQRPDRDKGDKLDTLVEKYKAQLFGAEGRGRADADGKRSTGLQRWFESA